VSEPPPMPSLFRFKELDNKEKAYYVRIMGSLTIGIISGIISGSIYVPGENALLISRIGFGLFWAQTFILAYFTRSFYNLNDWSHKKLIFHGLIVGFFFFLFFWIVIFNFMVVSQLIE
jgi:hypothetical protein